MQMPRIADIDTLLVDNLLKLGRAHAKAADLSLQTVSRKAFNDWRTLARLDRGECSITLSKYVEVRRWFGHNRPAGMIWPKIYEPWTRRKAINGEEKRTQKRRRRGRRRRQRHEVPGRGGIVVR